MTGVYRGVIIEHYIPDAIKLPYPQVLQRRTCWNILRLVSFAAIFLGECYLYSLAHCSFCMLVCCGLYIQIKD